MDFFDVIKNRRSIRVFSPRAVENQKVYWILDAANRAPSAGNMQAYRIYSASRFQDRAALTKAAYEQDFISSAPVCLVFCTDPKRSAERYGERGRELYAIQDATIACTHAMLAATALGLASVWVGAFDEEAVARAINIPEDFRPIAILPIGYPSETPPAQPRRQLSEVVIEVRQTS